MPPAGPSGARSDTLEGMAPLLIAGFAPYWQRRRRDATPD